MSEEKYCKYQLLRRWVSYNSGVTWSPLQEFRTGDLIEAYSEDCGYVPTPTPTVYRWVDVSGTCVGSDYHLTQKKQYSDDGGQTWQDVVPAETREEIEYDAAQCQPTPEVEYRWVDIPLTDDYYCSGTTKYYKQKKQQSTDSGSTWSDVVPAEYRMGTSAETQSADCGYAERTTSGSPYCVGVDKCIDLYHQESEDSGTSWTTTSTTVSVVEYNSEDCGYVPPTPSYETQYLTFRAREAGTFRFHYGAAIEGSVNYSLDSGTTWQAIENNENSPTIQSGETIMWKTSVGAGAGNPTGYFSSSGHFDVEGNIMSFRFGDNFIGQTVLSNAWAFYQLFKNCVYLISAENLILPATTLADSCYSGMFSGCTSLTAAPQLPTTTLVYDCYSEMFFNCTSLTTAPELPATTLAKWCYFRMFNWCTSLTTAPELLATTLTQSCYEYMFQDCSSLNYVKCLATDISATDCKKGWLGNVSSSGTFVKASGVSWPSGTSGIPQNWTVQDAT